MCVRVNSRHKYELRNTIINILIFNSIFTEKLASVYLNTKVVYLNTKLSPTSLVQFFNPLKYFPLTHENIYTRYVCTTACSIIYIYTTKTYSALIWKSVELPERS